MLAQHGKAMSSVIVAQMMVSMAPGSTPLSAMARRAGYDGVEIIG